MVQSRATVYAHNLRTDEIVGEVTGTSGDYDITMSADVGDRISVWQSINTVHSGTVEVIVPENMTIGGIPVPPDGGMGGSAD